MIILRNFCQDRAQSLRLRALLRQSEERSLSLEDKSAAQGCRLATASVGALPHPPQAIADCMRLAATNKCLALSNKSCTGGEATKERENTETNLGPPDGTDN